MSLIRLHSGLTKNLESIIQPYHSLVTLRADLTNVCYKITNVGSNKLADDTLFILDYRNLSEHALESNQ